MNSTHQFLKEFYLDIPIYEDPTEKPHVFITVQPNVPILGTIENVHKTVEAAKAFIDKHRDLLIRK